jgi:hypothetical protein
MKHDNDKKENSIWEQILKETSTQKDSDDTHIFIFGDKNSGKKHLIKSINKELYLNYETEERTLPQVDEYSSRFSFLEYKYLNVKKTNDTENEILGKMNLWFINEFLSSDFLETTLKPEYLKKAIFLVVLDLSKVRI